MEAIRTRLNFTSCSPDVASSMKNGSPSITDKVEKERKLSQSIDSRKKNKSSVSAGTRQHAKLTKLDTLPKLPKLPKLQLLPTTDNDAQSDGTSSSDLTKAKGRVDPAAMSSFMLTQEEDSALYALAMM